MSTCFSDNLLLIIQIEKNDLEVLYFKMLFESLKPQKVTQIRNRCDMDFVSFNT